MHRSPELLNAIDVLADELREAGEISPVQLVVVGALAGLLSGDLPAERLTGDVDVIWIADVEQWKRVEGAVARVASSLGLPSRWLNRDATVFADRLPLGWRSRLIKEHSNPPITLVRVSRIDLMGMKLISARVRMQDRSDLVALRPTGAELDFLSDHLDRVESEDLDRRDYADVRAIIEFLRGARHEES